jgi:hypothetical protein
MTYILNQLGSDSSLPNFGEGGIEYFGQTFVAGRLATQRPILLD